MSIFSPSKNNAVKRLEHLRDHKVDPGATSPMAPVLPGPDAVDGPVDEPEPYTDFEQAALDQITTRIREDFAGHGLTHLVAAVLRVEGYHCRVAPPGPDGGVDISAGRGLLGLDPPRLVAQVKSGDAPVGVEVVNQLQGVVSTMQAEQGLLVAWAGLTPQARASLRHQHLKVRVWEADDVVEAALRVYPELPERVRATLPLKRIWVVSQLEGT